MDPDGTLMLPTQRGTLARMRRCIEALLDQLDHRTPNREELQALRGWGYWNRLALRRRGALATLAQGATGFRLTDEARAALERLSRHRPPKAPKADHDVGQGI